MNVEFHKLEKKSLDEDDVESKSRMQNLKLQEVENVTDNTKGCDSKLKLNGNELNDTQMNEMKKVNEGIYETGNFQKKTHRGIKNSTIMSRNKKKSSEIGCREKQSKEYVHETAQTIERSSSTKVNRHSKCFAHENPSRVRPPRNLQPLKLDWKSRQRLCPSRKGNDRHFEPIDKIVDAHRESLLKVRPPFLSSSSRNSMTTPLAAVTHRGKLRIICPLKRPQGNVVNKTNDVCDLQQKKENVHYEERANSEPFNDWVGIEINESQIDAYHVPLNNDKIPNDGVKVGDLEFPQTLEASHNLILKQHQCMIALKKENEHHKTTANKFNDKNDLHRNDKSAHSVVAGDNNYTQIIEETDDINLKLVNREKGLMEELEEMKMKYSQLYVQVKQQENENDFAESEDYDAQEKIGNDSSQLDATYLKDSGIDVITNLATSKTSKDDPTIEFLKHEIMVKDSHIMKLLEREEMDYAAIKSIQKSFYGFIATNEMKEQLMMGNKLNIGRFRSTDNNANESSER